MLQPQRVRVKRSKEQTLDACARLAALLYIDLWILEGALRKWGPGLENIGYVARDTLTLLTILALALFPHQQRRSGAWFWVSSTMLVTLGAVQVMANLITVPMLALGVRAFVALALLPMLIWQYPNAISLPLLSRRIMMYVPLQACFVVLQVFSPANAPINQTIGQDAAGFVNFGVVRASGTFSAVSGLGAYLGVAFAVALVAMLSAENQLRRRSVIVAALTIFCAMLGGDRSTLITVAMISVVFAISLFLSPPHPQSEGRSGSVIALVALTSIVVAVAVTRFSFVVESFTRRFESAAASENPFERLWRQTIEFSGLIASPSAPSLSLLGDGVSSHTQAGIALGSPHPWVEIEASRWVAEMGLLGFALAWIRIALIFMLLIAAMRATKDNGPGLITFTALLASVALPGLITQTPSTQATFGVMISLVLLCWKSSSLGEGDATAEK